MKLLSSFLLAFLIVGTGLGVLAGAFYLSTLICNGPICGVGVYFMVAFTIVGTFIIHMTRS